MAFSRLDKINWYEFKTWPWACFDERWDADPNNNSQKFKLKVFLLWTGVLHLINFFILLGVSISFNLLSKQQAILDSSLLVIGYVPIGVVVLVWTGLTALYYMSYEFIWLRHDPYGLYDDMIHGHNSYRWIHYAITNSLMLFTICVVANVRDINFILVFCLLNVCKSLFFNMFDKHSGMETWPMGVFLTLIIWVFIIRQMILSNVNNYAVSAVSFGIIYDFLLLFCIKQKEYVFALIELLFKTVIAWMLVEYLVIY